MLFIPGAPRFRAQSASRLLQFSINVSLMVYRYRARARDAAETIRSLTDGAIKRHNGASFANINSINNIVRSRTKDRADGSARLCFAIHVPFTRVSSIGNSISRSGKISTFPTVCSQNVAREKSKSFTSLVHLSRIHNDVSKQLRFCRVSIDRIVFFFFCAN